MHRWSVRDVVVCAIYVVAGLRCSFGLPIWEYTSETPMRTDTSMLFRTHSKCTSTSQTADVMMEPVQPHSVQSTCDVPTHSPQFIMNIVHSTHKHSYTIHPLTINNLTHHLTSNAKTYYMQTTTPTTQTTNTAVI